MALSWQYIAGFFDGEGNVSMPLGKSNLHLCLTQAGNEGLQLLGRIQEFLAEHGIPSRIDDSTKLVTGRKKVYRLCLSGKRTEAFLRFVMPFVHIKKVISMDVLRWRTLYPGMYTSPMCKAWRTEAAVRSNNPPRLRTHCSVGHALTPENVYSYIGKSGHDRRQCKICVRARVNARYVPKERKHA